MQFNLEAGPETASALASTELKDSDIIESAEYINSGPELAT
jgi:hypothetical protein